jgi:hypothetical protein
MMNPFPEDWQLIGLFEGEPEVLDPEMPWSFNTLRFEFRRDLDRLRCLLLSADEGLEIHWWQADLLRLHLSLNWVRSLVVEITAGSDILVAHFRYGRGFVSPLRIQLRPHVSIAWGTEPAGEDHPPLRG